MIRFHPITGEPLLLAPARAARPNDFEEPGQHCPFCPGNEGDTPPEVARVGDPWRVRVFPNKYPATAHHEVIVESPRHGAAFHDLTVAGAVEVVSLYAQRYQAMRTQAESVMIFKNHGPQAGASLAHLHSQIIGTPFVPPRQAREIEGFNRAGGCPLCALPGVTIEETVSFVWLAPHASAMPYQSWIVPRVHTPELAPLDSVSELASLLLRASRAASAVMPSFNWIFMSFAAAPRAHWYVEIFPASPHSPASSSAAAARSTSSIPRKPRR